MDLARRFNDLIQIDTLTSQYRETKTVYLDQLKKIAIFGIYRGAVNYIETLLECTKVENLAEDMTDEINMNSTDEQCHLESLSNYLKHIFA